MEKTWIKLYRSLLDWCWFKDANTLQVFIWLLLNANIEDHGFQKIIVKRGQIVTSYPTICAATGLSVRSVRTAISHLKSTGELTGKQYPKFSLFTIEKYEQYQDVPTGITTGNRQSDDSQVTGNRQASDTNIRKKESKNVRKEEEKENIKRKSFVPPSVDDVAAYCKERQNKVDPQYFVDWYEMKGWKVGKESMKDWKAAVRTWERNNFLKNDGGKNKTNNSNIQQNSSTYKLLSEIVERQKR